MTLTLLRQISSKLDALIDDVGHLASGTSARGIVSKHLASRAAEIAEMTPETARQTDAAELLRQDRSR